MNIIFLNFLNVLKYNFSSFRRGLFKLRQNFKLIEKKSGFGYKLFSTFKFCRLSLAVKY